MVLLTSFTNFKSLGIYLLTVMPFMLVKERTTIALTYFLKKIIF